jgi:hypothetical protein
MHERTEIAFTKGNAVCTIRDLSGWCVELWQGEAAIQLKRLADQLIGCFAKTYDIARRAAAAVVSL